MPLRRPSSPRKPDLRAAADGPLPLEALEFESPSATIIATRVPPLSRAITFLVFLLVTATLAAAGLIQIDKIVTGMSKLVAETPNIVLQPFDQSIVESIDVRKGDIVRKGQVLARLNPTFSAADFTAMKDQLESLSATATRLEAEIAGSVYPPDAAALLVARETSTFELGALVGDGQSRSALGMGFSPAVAGLDAATAGTFALFDPTEQDAPPAEGVAESLLVLRAARLTARRPAASSARPWRTRRRRSRTIRLTGSILPVCRPSCGRRSFPCASGHMPCGPPQDRGLRWPRVSAGRRAIRSTIQLRPIRMSSCGPLSSISATGNTCPPWSTTIRRSTSCG